jgi:hypothetical protein
MDVVRRRQPACRKADGFSIVELLVAIGIVGLLLALLLPAIQSVRESARQTTCRNHLSQLTKAHLSFHDTFGHFVLKKRTTGLELVGMAAVFPQLELPWLDVLKNDQASHFEVLECPSDAELSNRHRPLSYALNTGSAYLGLGPFGSNAPTPDDRHSIRHLTDGTSHTACSSEILSVLSGNDETDAARTPNRFSWWITLEPNPPQDDAGLIAQTDLARRDCLHGPRELRTSVVPMTSGIGDWVGFRGYTHFLPPNAPQCLPRESSRVIPVWSLPIGNNHVAGSLHPGGVNLSLLDGQVRFINESIDDAVWSALGTIAGAESTPL